MLPPVSIELGTSVRDMIVIRKPRTNTSKNPSFLAFRINCGQLVLENMEIDMDVEGTRSLPFVFNSVAELPHKMRYDVVTTGFLNLRKCEREKIVSNALLVADLNECFSLSLPSKL